MKNILELYVNIKISFIFNFCRLTIWTIVLMSKMTEMNVTDEEGNLRTITADNLSWMLGVGWMFYICSLLLNLAYYKMHPSSPEMWTWGAVEELEEWTPTGEEEGERKYKL